jgi:hypothetical protein
MASFFSSCWKDEMNLLWTDSSILAKVWAILANFVTWAMICKLVKNNNKLTQRVNQAFSELNRLVRHNACQLIQNRLQDFVRLWFEVNFKNKWILLEKTTATGGE